LCSSSAGREATMNEIQALTYGGVLVLLILRQPLYAIIYILSVVFNVLDDKSVIVGLVALIGISLFQAFNSEAQKR
jgi:hypothetical protein